MILVLGAKLQALDGAGRSPLHYASKHGAVNVIHWLAETKVDLNVQDGKTHITKVQLFCFTFIFNFDLHLNHMLFAQEKQALQVWYWVFNAGVSTLMHSCPVCNISGECISHAWNLNALRFI